MTSANTLPDDVLDDAFASYREVQKRRVEACYNRHRAVFAEFLVARLLGAKVVEDPRSSLGPELDDWTRQTLHSGEVFRPVPPSLPELASATALEPQRAEVGV